MTLTVGELKLVAKLLNVSVIGLVEREAIERSIAEKVERSRPLGEQLSSTGAIAIPLAALPQKALREVLESRLIPHADLVVVDDLAKRAAQSTRGSCRRLPPRVLKQMLRDLGRREDIDGVVEKEELARRCMAARALYRAAGHDAAKQQREEERMFQEQERKRAKWREEARLREELARRHQRPGGGGPAAMHDLQHQHVAPVVLETRTARRDDAIADCGCACIVQ